MRELVSNDDIQRAVAVQQQLMPTAPKPLPGYSVSTMCVTALDVGGDFFDFYPVEGGAIITVADVMGKGLGAAILAASVRSCLRGATAAINHIAPRSDPSSAFNVAASQLAEDLDHTESFVTVFHSRLDTDTGKLTYIDAGHGLAVIVRTSGEIEQLTSDGLPVGVSRAESWISRVTTLSRCESLVVSSDGLIDLITGERKVTQLFDIVRRYPEPRDLCRIFNAMAEARPCADDVTLFALRRDPS